MAMVIGYMSCMYEGRERERGVSMNQYPRFIHLPTLNGQRKWSNNQRRTTTEGRIDSDRLSYVRQTLSRWSKMIKKKIQLNHRR